jgi:hypothetical protein
MTPTDRALDDVMDALRDPTVEAMRPENRVTIAWLDFLNAAAELRKVLTDEATRRLAAMEERDGEELITAMRDVERARTCALWRLSLEDIARGR